MSHAPNWGVPNWLFPKDYPAPNTAGAMMIWAWEFLRRNREFREFWVNKIEPFIMADGRVGRDRSGQLWPYYKELRNRFGINDPWSPRQNSRIPTFDDTQLTICEAPAVSYEWLPDQANVSAGPFLPASRTSVSKETLLENASLRLSWFEMGVAIDLSLPLDEQLKEIRTVTEERQNALKSAGLVGVKAIRESDQYALYLRILDAEDAGTKRSVIRDELFPDIDNDYPDCRRKKAYDNNRTEARRLRDSGYRALAFRARRALHMGNAP
jgi:hypothetical protein